MSLILRFVVGCLCALCTLEFMCKRDRIEYYILVYMTLFDGGMCERMMHVRLTTGDFRVDLV